MLKDKINLVKLDRRSSLSLNTQIYNEFKSLILGRYFAYREQLCDPKVCAELLGVTEAEIFKAFEQLLQENYLMKSENVFYVNQYDFSSDFFSRIIKVYDAIKDMGLEPSMEEVSKKIIKVDKSLSERSKYPVGSKVVYYRRLYKGNGQPLILLDLYFDLGLLPNFDQYVNEETPLYETIFQKYQRIVSKSHRIIDVINLPKDIAKLFNVKTHTAGFKVSAQTYDQHDALIEYAEGYSADNYLYEFEIPITEIIKDYKIMNKNL